ncbi:PPOX class F420-dependent oxidoreductase [Herbiconiux sp.]|uniref:PPOX class F420-dependent oxidoreductase n=1 Tax=Herbiconiux sp. TaxID=1871186 RepID=UPI0025C64018|nr:PPOX class F420-dependent oxidoreductase [Herbiconiux sp.]
MTSSAAPASGALLALGDERFVSLSTFRRTGEAVSTPVWIAREGDELLVTTPAGSGKVKRLRNSGRVELRPCSRSGKVDESVPPVEAVATIHDDPAEVAAAGEVFARKYRAEYRIFLFIERLVARGQKTRVILRIRS